MEAKEEKVDEIIGRAFDLGPAPGSNEGCTNSCDSSGAVGNLCMLPPLEALAVGRVWNKLVPSGGVGNRRCPEGGPTTNPSPGDG